MVTAPAPIDLAALADDIEIRFPPECPLTDELLLRLEAVNELRFERSAEGALVIMSFPGTAGVDAESIIFAQLFAWAAEFGGRALSSGAMYRLPSGAVRLADASWLTQAQWDALSGAERLGIMQRAPAFVLEVCSPGQALAGQQRKLERWIEGGVQLGWLLDQRSGRLWVYRPGAAPQALERPPRISGAPPLPGLTVDLSEVWR